MLSGVGLQLTMREVANASGWLLECLSIESPDNAIKIDTVLWCIGVSSFSEIRRFGTIRLLLQGSLLNGV